MAKSAKAIRVEMATHHELAERAGDRATELEAKGDREGANEQWVQAEAHHRQAEALREEYVAQTGSDVSTDGTVHHDQAVGDSHSFELSAKEVLIAEGIDPTDMSIDDQERRAEVVKEGQAAEAKAEYDREVREFIEEALGVDTSKLSDEELKELVDANQQKVNQKVFQDEFEVIEPEPIEVEDRDGNVIVIDQSKGLEEALKEGPPLHVPDHLRDKVKPGDGTEPDAGSGGGPGGPGSTPPPAGSEPPPEPGQDVAPPAPDDVAPPPPGDDPRLPGGDDPRLPGGGPGTPDGETAPGTKPGGSSTPPPGGGSGGGSGGGAGSPQAPPPTGGQVPDPVGPGTGGGIPSAPGGSTPGPGGDPAPDGGTPSGGAAPDSGGSGGSDGSGPDDSSGGSGPSGTDTSTPAPTPTDAGVPAPGDVGGSGGPSTDGPDIGPGANQGGTSNDPGAEAPIDTGGDTGGPLPDGAVLVEAVEHVMIGEGDDAQSVPSVLMDEAGNLYHGDGTPFTDEEAAAWWAETESEFGGGADQGDGGFSPDGYVVPKDDGSSDDAGTDDGQGGQGSGDGQGGGQGEGQQGDDSGSDGQSGGDDGDDGSDDSGSDDGSSGDDGSDDDGSDDGGDPPPDEDHAGPDDAGGVTGGRTIDDLTSDPHWQIKFESERNADVTPDPMNDTGGKPSGTPDDGRGSGGPGPAPVVNPGQEYVPPRELDPQQLEDARFGEGDIDWGDDGPPPAADPDGGPAQPGGPHPSVADDVRFGAGSDLGTPAPPVAADRLGGSTGPAAGESGESTSPGSPEVDTGADPALSGGIDPTDMGATAPSLELDADSVGARELGDAPTMDDGPGPEDLADG